MRNAHGNRYTINEYAHVEKAISEIWAQWNNEKDEDMTSLSSPSPVRGEVNKES
jgi:hypothetical protein